MKNGILVVVAMVLAFGCVAAAQKQAADAFPTLRTGGTVYLLVKPGELSVDLRRRNVGKQIRRNGLLAILTSPTREVEGTLLLDADRKDDPWQSGRMTATVEREGIYRLEILNRNSLWQLATNAAGVVFAPEEKKFQLRDSDAPVDLFFEAPFSLRANASLELKPSGQGLRRAALYHPDGKLLKTFDFEDGPAARTFKIPAGTLPDKQLWRLSLDGRAVTLESDPPIRWSPAKERYFRSQGHDRLLTPHRRSVYLQAGGDRTLEFLVSNGFPGEHGFSLRVEGGADGAISVSLPAQSTFRLGSGEERWVPVHVLASEKVEQGKTVDFVLECVASGAGVAGRKRSEIRVVVGAAPASRPLEMPIILKPYRHENALFGYLPEYSTNAPEFDLANRPYIRQRRHDHNASGGIEVLHHEKWDFRSFRAALEAAVPGLTRTVSAGGFSPVKTAFDAENDLYTGVMVEPADGNFRDRQVVLLHSADQGRTFQGYPVGERGNVNFDIEQFTGHNPPHAGPPAFLVYRETAKHKSRWGRINRLELYRPSKSDGRLRLGKPVLISEACIGLASHSGGSSALATRDGRTHIIWGEAVEAGSELPGVPTYVATYDHVSGVLSQPALIGYGAPVNDVHNSPGIVLDSKGYLHAVTGAHGQPFHYARSLVPHTAAEGWTASEPVLTQGRVESDAQPEGRGSQTYLGLVCTPDDVLHLVSRQWRARVDPWLDGDLHAALSYQRKFPGKPWENARPLVVPPLPDYSVWYHKLTIDRIGRIFASYSYRSVHRFYRTHLPGRIQYAAVIFSSDSGKTWKLAETRDFQDGIGR